MKMDISIQRAIDLWIELTGIDPNATSYTMRDWDIRSMNNELKESFKLDSTGITTLMILNYFAKYYFDNRKFNVNEMMNDFDMVIQYLNKTREFYLLINNDEFLEIEKEFQEKVLSAAVEYGMDSKHVLELINDRDSLAFIRRDALRSMESLEIHQFTHGVADEENPKYLKDVYMFWNINSLLRYIGNAKYSSISLNLIKSSDGYNSYFVFGIRNGSTISILTDVPKHAHPLSGQMSRRPDRSFANRYAKNHFPYELLDFNIDEEAGKIYFNKESGLVPYQIESVSLKPIKELEADEIVWTIVMFDLIKQKFWNEDYKTPQLSYTGEMIHDKLSLVDNIKIKVDNYLPLEAKPLTKDEISYGVVDKEFREGFEKNNKWLEEEYNHVVPEEVLNLVNTKEGLKLLQDASGQKLLPLSTFTEKRLQEGNAVNLNGLNGINPSLFGTAEEMISNQKWYARYNQAKVINNEIKSKYKEDEESVLIWFNEKLKKNLPFLHKRIAYGDLVLTIRQQDRVYDDKELYKKKNILMLTVEDKLSNQFFWRKGNIYLDNYDSYANKHYCLYNGKEASLFAIFKPTTPENIATLCNCKVEELPIPLQNWYEDKFYRGNSILDRLDPMEWVAENPWFDFKFNIVVRFSKSTYNELRKNNGLEPNKFWLEPEKIPFLY